VVRIYVLAACGWSMFLTIALCGSCERGWLCTGGCLSSIPLLLQHVLTTGILSGYDLTDCIEADSLCVKLDA
jgi:hypothetical protein